MALKDDKLRELIRQIDEFLTRPDKSEWNTVGFLTQLRKAIAEGLNK